MAAGHEVEHELIVALASAVMSDQRVVLALELLGRGPHMLDRATDLASAVLRGATLGADTQTRGAAS